MAVPDEVARKAVGLLDEGMRRANELLSTNHTAEAAGALRAAAELAAANLRVWLDDEKAPVTVGTGAGARA